MSVEADGTVRHEVVVDLSVEEAFWRFADLDKIKPREHNLLDVPVAETVLEQRTGGDVYDRGVDGSTCRWGRVLRFEPPEAIAFTWDIGPDWEVTRDLDRASEVEVTFEAQGERRTRVLLVHRHFERHGEGWESLRGDIDSGNGWPLYLSRYDALTRDQLEV